MWKYFLDLLVSSFFLSFFPSFRNSTLYFIQNSWLSFFCRYLQCFYHVMYTIWDGQSVSNFLCPAHSWVDMFSSREIKKPSQSHPITGKVWSPHHHQKGEIHVTSHSKLPETPTRNKFYRNSSPHHRHSRERNPNQQFRHRRRVCGDLIISSAAISYHSTADKVLILVLILTFFITNSQIGTNSYQLSHHVVVVAPLLLAVLITSSYTHSHDISKSHRTTKSMKSRDFPPALTHCFVHSNPIRVISSGIITWNIPQNERHFVLYVTQTKPALRHVFPCDCFIICDAFC